MNKIYKQIKKFVVKRKALSIGIIALVLVAGSFSFVANVAKGEGVSFWDKVAQYTAQILGKNITDKLETSGILEQTLDETFGAMPGSEIQGPCFKVNGVEECSYSKSFTPGTSTPAYIKSPNASSTLVDWPTAYFSYVSSTEATWVEIANSTTQYATTTSFGYLAYAANTGGLLIGSTTDVSTAKIIPPNTYIVVKLSGGAGTSHVTGWTNTAPKGFLKATFRIFSQ